MDTKDIIKKYWFVGLVAVLLIVFVAVYAVDLNKNKEVKVDTLTKDGMSVIYSIDDNDYYLSHAFNKSNNIAGWIFADYRDDFKTFNNNTIIYGHNTLSNSMFGQLPNTLKPSWQNNKNYHYIKLSTKTTN